MKRIPPNILSFLLIALVIFLPFFVLSDTSPGPDTKLIVCDGPDCTFDSLIKLGINIMNFIIVISIPLAAIAFVVAGFKLITSAGNESGLTDAKKIFTNTAIGLVIVLAAWLIIKTILLALLDDPAYSLLG